MKQFNNKTIIIGASISLIAVIAIILYGQNKSDSQLSNGTAIHSHYAGQETRGIKALSQDDIKGLLAGTGTPFGGMAKPAELNSYPGPRHVLDAIEAGELNVTAEQKVEIEKLYEEMRAQAIDLGEQIIALEQKIDTDFTDKTVTENSLRDNLADSAGIYGQLRFVHLKHHLYTVDILTPEQVERYNLLRGYIGDTDPCENIPKGHDSVLWKIHNSCE